MLRALAFSFLLLTPLAVAQTPPATATPTAPVLAPVLVSGEQPGPGLWKISRGDHVLWILGTQQPLPKNFVWRSTEVEKIVAASQAVLADADASAQIGFFRMLTLAPALYGARRNAGGKTLREVLPPDLYARWAALKDRYLGRDRGVERLRPMFAANELYRAAIRQSGMTNDNLARNTVEVYAKRHKVPVVATHVKIDIDDPRKAIDEFKGTAGDLDAMCLDTTITRLETDLDAMRARANAWAVGDLGKLASLPYPDQRAACLAAVSANADLREKLDAARRRVDAAWLVAAENALAKNASTLAVLPIGELLESDGRLAQLRAKGYTIEEPGGDP